MADSNVQTYGVVLMVVGVPATITSWFLIVSLVRNRGLEKSYNKAFISLAVADATLSLFAAALKGPGLVFGEEDNLKCHLVYVLSQVLPLVTKIAVVPLTLDRFTAVFVPFRYSTRQYKNYLLGAILGCWVFVIWYPAALLIYAHFSTEEGGPFKYQPDIRVCYINYGDAGKWLDLFRDILVLVLPLVLQIAVYVLILFKISSINGQREKRGMVNVILVRAVVICFFFSLSWIPWFIAVRIYQPIYGDISLITELVVSGLMYSNIVTDPLLYVICPYCVKKIRKEASTKTTRSSRRRTTANMLSVRENNNQSTDNFTKATRLNQANGSRRLPEVSGH